MPEHYVVALDQGTTSTRCIVFDRRGQLVAVAQREHRQHFPKPGWVEHDAAEIWHNVERLLPAALDQAGGLHITDVTNASRTMLMDINALRWDPELLDFFGIPAAMLPEIRSSVEIYGTATRGLPGVRIAAALGDQQAALFGQVCFAAGEAKCTYGTGSFLLLNTGAEPVRSTH